MSYLFFLFITVLSSTLFAENVVAAQADEGAQPAITAPAYQPPSLVNMTAMPSTIVNGSVNVITGDYSEIGEDYVISGPDPFVLGHAYFSSSLEEGTLGSGWNFFHHHRLQVVQPDGIKYVSRSADLTALYSNDEEREEQSEEKTPLRRYPHDGYYHRHQPAYAFLFEPYGGRLQFQADYDNNTKKMSSFSLKTKNTGFTNVCGDTIGAVNTITNSSIKWHKRGDYWTTVFPDGTQRTYKRREKSGKKSHSEHNRHYQVSTERKPSGNISLYEYNDKYEITKVQTYDKTRSTLQHVVQFNQKSTGDFARHPSLHVTSSDGEECIYYFNHLKGSKKNGVYAVSGIKRQGFPYVRFQYSKKSSNHKKRVIKKSSADGYYLDTRYYGKVNNVIGDKKITFKNDKQEAFNRNKVRYQAMPVGPYGKKEITHSYYYFRDANGGGHTKVVDAKNATTRYYWNKQKRLIKVKQPDHSCETFVWGKGPNQGRLMARTQWDENGLAQASKEFHYDKKGNVVEEIFYGRITKDKGEIEFDALGCPSSYSCDKIKTSYTYSKDRFHLKTSECDSMGNYTYYRYVEGTSLLQAKFTCEKDKIKKREFYSYDGNGLCVEQCVDDGSKEDKKRFDDVTERHITRYTHRCTLPHFDAPIEIAEYYYDIKKKKEQLLGKTIHSYSEKGFVIKKELFDSAMKSVAIYIYAHDDIGRVIYTRNPLGDEERYTYDSLGRVIKKEGPRQDLVKEYEYDLMGRVVKETDTQDGTVLVSRYEYDALGRKTATIDPQGHYTRYEYDCMNRMTKICYPTSYALDGSVVRSEKNYSYSECGSVSTETDERGFVTTRKYNTCGKPFVEKFPDGTKKRYQYDKKGNLIKTTSETGLKEYSSYDSFNRVTATSLKKEKRTLSSKSMTYSGFHLMKEKRGDGQSIRYSYDDAGRKRSQYEKGKHGLTQKKITYAYDSLSRLSVERLYTGPKEYVATFYNYDVLHRKVKESVKDQTGVSHASTLFEYDALGNCSKVSGMVGGKLAITQSTYYRHGLIKEITDPQGNTTHFFYDFFFPNTHGELVLKKSTIDSLGVKTEEQFDPRGNLTSVCQFDPWGKILSKQERYYDAAKNLVDIVDSVFVDGTLQNCITTSFAYGPTNREEHIVEAKETHVEKTTEFCYNEFGQKIGTHYSDGNGIVFAYDEKGRVRLSYALDNSFSYDYVYDRVDRITEVQNNLTMQKTTRQYDDLGNLLSETLENGLTVEYGYDKAARVNRLTLPDGSDIRYHYSPLFIDKIERFDGKQKKQYEHLVLERDSSGRVLSSKLPLKGGELTFEYDTLGRMTEIAHSRYSQKVPTNGYDAVGNLREMKTKDPQGVIESHFGYDYLHQLTKERGVAEHKYAYDSLYNRLQIDDAKYKLNALHSVLYDGKSKYRYDKRANRLEMRTEDKNTVYRYDTFDRLVEVVQEGHKRILYGYDAFDRRLEKTVFSFTPVGWKQESHERYLYIDTKEVGAVDDKNMFIQLRILGDSVGNANGAEMGAAVAIELHSKVYVPLHDIRGNVALLLDASTGGVAETYRYDAFGNEERFAAHELNNPWRFASKRVDEETGFVFFGRRYYDPSLGKWLTHDPLGVKAGPNLYAYVHNSPMTHHDLYGLLDEFTGPPERSFGGRMMDHVVEGCRWAATQVRNLGCKLAEEVIHNLPHIGGLNNYIEDKLRGWRGVGAKIRPPTGRYEVRLSNAGENGNTDIDPFTFQNGLGCGFKDAEKNMRFILEGTGGKYTSGYMFYTEEKGLCMDLGRALLNILGIRTPNIDCFAAGFKEVMTSAEHSQSRFVCFPHSHGGQTLNLTRGMLSKELCDRMDIRSLGSSHIFSGAAQNYFGGSDFVPLIADPVGYIAAAVRGLFGESNCTYTGHPFKIPLSNHHLRSKEYGKVIKEYFAS